MANPSLQIGDSNWAIKEDNLLGYSKAGTRFVPQPITMTRESAGTRVNSEGLVETVELLGSELVTNGDFATDSGWIKGTGWTISGGTAILDGTQTGGSSLSSSNMTVTVGKIYKVTVNVSATSSGFRLYDALGVVSYGLSLGENIFYRTPSSSTYTLTPLGLAGASGIITSVSVKEYTVNNLARVDYDGSVSSLLAEPQRTNLVTTSEELNSTTNVTSSNTTSPDGTLSGLKLNETTSNSQHYGTSYEASVVDDGTIYTISFYIKKGTNDLVKVYTQSSRISASIWITFSTESTSLSGSDVVSGSNFMEDAGNGWYRVGFSTTANSTGSVSIYLPPKDLTTYVGDVSQYTEYWGAQLEAGSYATSYIPTDGTTVTRVQDQYEKTGISDLINSEEGTIFVEMAALANDSTNRYISINDGSSINRMILKFGTSSNNISALGLGTATSFSMVNSGATITTMNKIALKYKANDCALWINGVEVETDLTFTAYAAGTLNQINLSNYVGTSQFLDAKVKQLQVFKTALTDPELTALTT